MSDCVFCNIDESRIEIENDLALSFKDLYPVTDGHTLVIPKRKVQFFTENLRKMGYYCSNNSKEDYNMEMSPLAWDESNKNAHWRNRNENQPFFSVFNFNITHESRIWGNYKKHSNDEIKELKEEGIDAEVIPWVEDTNN